MASKEATRTSAEQMSATQKAVELAKPAVFAYYDEEHTRGDYMIPESKVEAERERWQAEIQRLKAYGAKDAKDRSVFLSQLMDTRKELRKAEARIALLRKEVAEADKNGYARGFAEGKVFQRLWDVTVPDKSRRDKQKKVCSNINPAKCPVHKGGKP